MTLYVQTLLKIFAPERIERRHFFRKRCPAAGKDILNLGMHEAVFYGPGPVMVQGDAVEREHNEHCLIGKILDRRQYISPSV